MKWVILLADVGICGGVNVIYEHIAYAYGQGVEITIASREKLSSEDAQWHDAAECAEYKTYEECGAICYDAAIATGWNTVYDVYRINARKYVYFVQAVESRFHKNQNTVGAKLAEMTYVLPFQYITEATWIREYLCSKYGWQARLVLNGINKNIFHDSVEPYTARQEGKLRILIEGNVDNWRKNIEETVALCRRSEADEIWLMTSSKINAYEGIDRVFSKVPMRDVPRVYASCDVLVKLSLAEGMFGPPLEMFHCGGTAVIYDIEGTEEYIIHEYNALVVQKDNPETVVAAVNELKRNPGKLRSLKANAQKTAQKWRGWDCASREFYETVMELPETDERDQRALMRETRAYQSWFGLEHEEAEAVVPESVIREILQRISCHNLDVILYGAGSVAGRTIKQLSGYGIPISGVIVSSPANNPKVLLGHKVCGAAEYMGDKERNLVVIATRKYKEEILERMEQLKFPHVVCIS